MRAGAAASTASRSYVRDDRETPLVWDGMATDIDLIWGVREQEYFCKGDWTGQIRLIRLKNFRSARKSAGRAPTWHQAHNVWGFLNAPVTGEADLGGADLGEEAVDLSGQIP
jgi:hypothetical protein